MANLVIPDGGNIGSASDPDAISIASSGKPTFSQGIANTGTIDAGTIGNNVTVQGSFGVTDITDQFTVSGSWLTGGTYGSDKLKAYHFNGFVFFTMHIYIANTTPSTGAVICTIDNSNYYPANTFSAPTVSHEGDTAMHVQFETDGDITINYAVNAGGGNFSVLVNCFYRT